MAITRLISFLFVLLFAVNASASCGSAGFGTTYGTSATTDQVQTISTSIAALAPNTSFSAWIYIKGSGGGTNGTLFNQTDASNRVFSVGLQAGANFIFSLNWTSGGSWTWPLPTLNRWHHIGFSYNGGSTSNNPHVYIDGVSQTITVATPVTGSIALTTGKLTFGNRGQTNDRAWDGMVADMNAWNVALSDAELIALSGGAPAQLLRPAANLIFSDPLCFGATKSYDYGINRNVLTVTGSKLGTAGPRNSGYPFTNSR